MTIHQCYFLLVFTALLFAGCDKCPEFTGQVLEFGTEKPIKGALVSIVNCHASPDLLSTSCDNLRTDSTDAEGHYWFEQNFASVITAQANLYYPTPSGGLGLNGKSNCRTPIDIHLYPFSWIRTTAINQKGIFEVFSTKSEQHLGQSTQFAVPPNDSIVVFQKLRGNLSQGYKFSIWHTLAGPILKDNDSLSCYVNGIEFFPTYQYGMTLELVPIGQNTLDIKIIY